MIPGQRLEESNGSVRSLASFSKNITHKQFRDHRAHLSVVNAHAHLSLISSVLGRLNGPCLPSENLLVGKRAPSQGY